MVVFSLAFFITGLVLTYLGISSSYVVIPLYLGIFIIGYRRVKTNEAFKHTVLDILEDEQNDSS